MRAATFTHRNPRLKTSIDAPNCRAADTHSRGRLPCAVRRPERTLVIDILDVAPVTWGYTAFGPGRGLLPNDFERGYLRIWDLSDWEFGRGFADVRVPLAPFCGVMGVALAESGSHSTAPPRRVGGNMDVRQLTAGTRLYLPVEVDGALFSVGDAHAAQGDGEVCITAIEMDSTTRLRFSLSETEIREPELDLRNRRRPSAGRITAAPRTRPTCWRPRAMPSVT